MADDLQKPRKKQTSSNIVKEVQMIGPHISGTIGEGLVVFPLSLVMHFYGSENQPSFVPNFVFYFVVTIIAAFFIWRSKGKVRSNGQLYYQIYYMCSSY